MFQGFTDWHGLRLWLAHGGKSTKPVLISTTRHVPYHLRDAAALNVLFSFDEPLDRDIRLLANLPIIAVLDRCSQLAKLYGIAAKAKVQLAARFKVWCPCSRMVLNSWHDCDAFPAPIDVA